MENKMKQAPGLGNVFTRMENCKNPWQGTRKRVLCVCSAGLLRSPTAAALLIAEWGYNARACGIEPGYALIPIDEVLVRWADFVVCMDKRQEGAVKHFDKDKKIYCLGIADAFGYMEPEIERVMRDRLTAELGPPIQTPGRVKRGQ